MKIVLTGASGLVGKNLIRSLLADGHQVFALARTPSNVKELPPENVFQWNSLVSAPAEGLRGMDVVINLAGEGVADKPWTAERKTKLIQSRRATTLNLVNGIFELEKNLRPRILLSASGIGVYGSSPDQIFDESSAPGHDFLADLCVKWEADAARAADLDLRVVMMRFGLILSKDGGFLSKMAPVVLGDGQQWMSWIHIDDVIQFVKTAILNSSFSGPYNLVSPIPISNKDFTKHYAKTKGFPFTIPAPSFILKTVLGEMSEMILASQRVLPDRLIQAGFKFHYTDLKKALSDIYKPT
jgi:uncharacterized protein